MDLPSLEQTLPPPNAGAAELLGCRAIRRRYYGTSICAGNEIIIATGASEENECLLGQSAIEDVVDGESAESPLVL
jgi:hypothetical protein